jgi:hypothetical protein
MDWQQFFDRMVIGFFVLLLSFVGVVLVGLIGLAVAQEAGPLWGVLVSLGVVAIAVMFYCLPGAKEREDMRRWADRRGMKLNSRSGLYDFDIGVPRYCGKKDKDHELNKQNP